MGKLCPVCGHVCTEMVGRLGVWIAGLSWLALLLPKRQASFTFHLPEMVVQQLNGSSAQFEAWTSQLSEHLSLEQQQRLAWSVHFLETPRSTLQLRQLQEQLSPVSGAKNTFKLWLWIRFYWQLRRSHLLSSHQMLLPHFALTLRQLQTDPQWASAQVQNMLQSLPRYLGVLVRSQWLCLQHARDQLYALPAGALELGANSNCCMWQVQVVGALQDWLRLENACEPHATWFISMLQHVATGTYMLHNAPSDNSSTYCIRNGAGYLAETPSEAEEEPNKRRLGKDCHWQLNDCTQLPTILRKYFGE